MKLGFFTPVGLVLAVFMLVLAPGCDNDDGKDFGTKGSGDTSSTVTTDVVDTGSGEVDVGDPDVNDTGDTGESSDVNPLDMAQEPDNTDGDVTDSGGFADGTETDGQQNDAGDVDSGDSGTTELEPPVLATTAVDIYGYLFYNQQIDGGLDPQVYAGYLLSAYQGAKIKVDLSAVDPAVNFALFVFGPAQGATFLDPPLVWSQDSVGPSPTVSWVSEFNGKYLVVVAHNGTETAEFSMVATCDGEACGSVNFVALPCPPALVDDVAGCMADLYSDPESTPETPQDAAILCADAEPLADAYDSQCLGTERPLYCGADYGLFWGDIQTQCQDAGFYEYVGQDCLFGARFVHLFAPESAVVVTADQWFYPESLPDLLTEAQIKAAVASKVNNIDSYVAAILAVDDNQVRLLEVTDLARRVFTVIEFGLGDTSLGLVFQHGTTDVVASINDGDFVECAVKHTLAGSKCAGDVDCGIYDCVGIWDGTGRCADAEKAAGEGASCNEAFLTPCVPGLYCAGLSMGEEGICVAPWMVGTFFQLPVASITDEGTTTRSIVVNGVATVSIDVHLKVTVSHWDVSQLVISLTNPAGTEVPVYAGEIQGTGLDLDLPLSGFPGDESANGVWTLTIHDTKAGGIGTLDYWTLKLTSRLD